MIEIGLSERILAWLDKSGIPVPANIRRVTIDLDRLNLARIYFDCFADSSLFENPLDLSDVEIVRDQTDKADVEIVRDQTDLADEETACSVADAPSDIVTI